MRVRCPHCQCALEILADVPEVEVVCPSCGSSVSGTNETLISLSPDVKMLGRFQLLECVGRGYFGEVWKARDSELRRTVAIKVPRTQELTEETRERFLREAKATALLRHPNIVPVHEVGRDEGTIFIVSDFIDGMTLAERISIDRPAPREAAELCQTLALALHHAHEAGVVHRDLKPSNIMIDLAKKPYLMDFGLAKQEAGEFTMTASGDILGTPAYMPPEQARGDSHLADRRSDVYSMGVILYELLTGERPFKGSTHLLLKAILNVEPQAPSRITQNIPRDLETICLKAMAKEPHRRYATAQEFADDLQRFLRGESIIARRATVVERGCRWVRRNPLLASSLAVSVIAVIGFIGLFVQARASTPELVRHSVLVPTKPPGAKLVFHRLSPTDGELDILETVTAPAPSPSIVKLADGDYLVVAVPNDTQHAFHEVYRRVPESPGAMPGTYRHERWKVRADGTLELPEIELPDPTVINGMVEITGAKNFVIGDPSLTEAPPHIRIIPDYLLDPTEITVEATATLEATTLSLVHFKQHNNVPAKPLTHVGFDEAVYLAERFGKRLPSEAEYEFTATNSGETVFPWGADSSHLVPWDYANAGIPASDQNRSWPPIYGLFSNVAEWTSSKLIFYPKKTAEGFRSSHGDLDRRIVRGGDFSVVEAKPELDGIKRGPRSRLALLKYQWSPGLGFRCARSAKPRLQASDFESIVSSKR